MVGDPKAVMEKVLREADEQEDVDDDETEEDVEVHPDVDTAVNGKEIVVEGGDSDGKLNGITTPNNSPKDKGDNSTTIELRCSRPKRVVKQTNNSS